MDQSYSHGAAPRPAGRALFRTRITQGCTLWRCLFASVLFLQMIATKALADHHIETLADLDIEKLTQVEVTSVSRKSEKLVEAPAAVFVITAEDIRRSGHTTVADALRLVPGMQVARINSHNWAISARGFNELYANKLLVMIDGRSVYTPLFSGVYWDVQDLALEDIESIEVIRGPGATLWGANAVNGVINITTRSSKHTQGGLVVGGYGPEEQGFATLRYGGQLAENATYKLYGKYFNRDESVLDNGDSANDAWHMYRGGLRIDWEPGEGNLLTFDAGAYGGSLHDTFTFKTPVAPFFTEQRDKTRVHGAHVIGRWTHTFSSDAELKLQTYYDRTSRELDFFNEDQNTFDIDLQHRQKLGERHEIVAGLGYQFVGSYNLRSNFFLYYDPAQRETHLFSTFVQDEVSLIEDTLSLTLGSKFEHNDYTGFEIQPSGRLLWTPDARNTVWGGVSRAVRTPSRADNDSHLVSLTAPAGDPRFPNPPFPPLANVATIDGSGGFEAEELLAYELGYRVRPHQRAAVDLALFYNDYDDLRSFEYSGTDLSNAPNYARHFFKYGNGIEGETYGGEVALNLQLAEWWQMRGSYSYIQIQLHTKPGSLDTTQEAQEGRTPHHQAALRSLMDLPWNFQFDLGARYVDSLPALSIPSYIAVDARVSWRPTRNLEISVSAQNILDDRHPEFRSSVVGEQQTEVERAVYGRVTWRF
jgi:iron complex outermembrane recepter protein